MSSNNLPTPKAGVLASSRRRLMAAVFGIGVATAMVGGSFMLQNAPIASAAAETMAVAPQALAAQQPFSFANVVERVRPAVVSVKVKTVSSETMSDGGPGMSPDDPMFRFFRQFGFGDEQDGAMPMRPRQRKQFGMSQGSGFFISADGYIVTNNHVVDHASEVDVVMDGGKTYTAKVIGVDPKTDLALIKVNDGNSFPYVELGSSLPRVGDWVIAVGNPFGLGGTVTAGIVSARGRDIGSGPYDDFLQIDAPVNRGNSGGPTFDLSGNVIGVNTAIYSPSGGSVGIGFAIPSDTVKRVVEELKSNGQVTRGWIGVQIQPVTPDIAESVGLAKAAGALVADVTKDGPAAKAGILTGDAILAVNGTEVTGPRDLARLVAGIRPGTAADLKVWRERKEVTVKVDTGRLPGERQRADLRSPAQPEESPTALAGLGLQLAPAESVEGAGRSGLVVTDVDPDGGAADSLRTGDVILDVGGKPVNSVSDLRRDLAALKAEGRNRVLLRVKNARGMQYVAVPVGKV